MIPKEIICFGFVGCFSYCFVLFCFVCLFLLLFRDFCLFLMSLFVWVGVLGVFFFFFFCWRV